MRKKKSIGSFSQKNVEELSEDSLDQVAGGDYVLTGDPEFDRKQIETFSNLPHMQRNDFRPIEGGITIN